MLAKETMVIKANRVAEQTIIARVAKVTMVIKVNMVTIVTKSLCSIKARNFFIR
jgi:hypothetical protein